MMNRRSPALRKALDCLRARIAASGPGRLPVIGVLARSAGVSHVTMSRAVRQLALEGLVTVRQRAGIHATGEAPLPLTAPETVTPARRGCKWERLCGRITADIRSGAIAPSSSVSTKEMAAHYAVARGTMARALGSLVDAGILVAAGARYRAAAPRPPGAGATVVLVAAGVRGSLAQPTDRTAANLRALESLCAARDISLCTVPYDWREGRPLSAALHAAGLERSGAGAVLGWMIWAAGMATERTFGLVRELRNRDQPVAVLDEWGEAAFVSLLDAAGQVGLFELGASRQCGLQLGNVLAGLGHRRVAYLSAAGDAPWSQRRCEGIAAAFGERRPGSAVVAIERAMYRAMSSWRESDAALARALGDSVRRCWSAAEPAPAVADTLASLAARLPEALWNARYREAVEPIFESALAHADVRAWVCDNDLTACHALDFLARAGRDVPGDISVAGFDNAPMASQHNLTSYDFNADGALRAMLAHITGPRRPSQRRAIEVPGFVVRRGTVGPPTGRE